MIASIQRTVVPLIVGWVVTGLAALGIDTPDSARTWLAGAIGGVIAAGYYVAARWAERKWPKLSLLLGSTKQPSYDSGKTAAPPEP